MTAFRTLLLFVAVSPCAGASAYTPQVYVAMQTTPVLQGYLNSQNKIPPCSLIVWDLGSDCSLQCKVVVSFNASQAVQMYWILESDYNIVKPWVTGLPPKNRTKSSDYGGCLGGKMPAVTPLFYRNASKLSETFTSVLQSRVFIVLPNPTTRNIMVAYSVKGSPLVVADTVIDNHFDQVVRLLSGIATWKSSTYRSYVGVDFYHDQHTAKGLLALQYNLKVSYTGLYRVMISSPDAPDAPSATDAKYRIDHDGGQTWLTWDQSYSRESYLEIGQFYFSLGTGQVTLFNNFTNGRVVADAIQLKFVRPDDPTDCQPDPCLYGGFCVEGIANFTCLCNPPYDGRYCEHAIPPNAVRLDNYSWPFTQLLQLGLHFNDRINNGLLATEYFLPINKTDATITPKKNQTVPVPSGTLNPLRWTEVESLDGVFSSGPTNSTQFIKYYACALYSPTRQTGVRLGLMHDQGLLVYAGGVSVYSSPLQDFSIIRRSSSFTLPVGWTQLLFKVQQLAKLSSRLSVWIDHPVWFAYSLP